MVDYVTKFQSILVNLVSKVSEYSSKSCFFLIFFFFYCRLHNLLAVLFLCHMMLWLFLKARLILIQGGKVFMHSESGIVTE